MANVSHKAILQTLEEKNRWVTFDELINSVPREYDCIIFMSHLDRMVERGEILHIPAQGGERAYYGHKGLDA